MLDSIGISYFFILGLVFLILVFYEVIKIIKIRASIENRITSNSKHKYVKWELKGKINDKNHLSQYKAVA